MKRIKRYTALVFSFCLMVGFSFGQVVPKDSSSNEPGNNIAEEENAVSLEAPAEDKSTGSYQYKNNYFPASPNAASLGTYGETPVSYFTGTPSVNIPIYEMKGVELTLPISLSYNASGIRVEENASWVGLGWSLNAGGTITRSIRGKDDLVYPLMLQLPLSSDEANIDNTFSELLNYQSGVYDSEPDIYNYNFMGHSGSFIFDSDGTPVFSSYINFLVTRSSSGMEITTDDGMKYEFASIETTGRSTGNPITAYNLTKITSYSGREEINFTYEDEYFKHFTQPYFEVTLAPQLSPGQEGGIVTGFTPFPGGQYSPDGPRFCSSVQNYSKRLSQIQFVGLGTLEFIKGSLPREDLGEASSVTAYSLSEIRIKDFNNVLIKKFKLDSEYISSSNSYAGFPSSTGCPTVTGNDYINKRLYLKSFYEIGQTSGKVIGKYLFNYLGRNSSNQDLLPHKLSAAQDHWGFYNGEDGNQFLFPGFCGKYGYSDEFSGDDFYSQYGLENSSLQQWVPAIDRADREVSYPEMSYGTLEKIVYPTGGETEFTYEPHEFEFVGNESPPDRFSYCFPDASQNLAGGLRVKEIIDKDKGLTLKSSEFTYARGVLKNFPLYHTYWFNSAGSTLQPNEKGIKSIYHTVPHPGLSPDYRLYVEINCGQLNDQGYRNGPHIGYEVVKQKNYTLSGTTKAYNGEIAYNYRTLISHPETYEERTSDFKYVFKDYLDDSYDLENYILTNNNVYPFRPGRNIDWKYGQLVRKTIRNSTNILVQEEISDFAFNNLRTVYGAKIFPYRPNLDFNFFNYKFVEGWPTLSNSTKKSYDLQGGNEVSQSTSMEYLSPNHKYLTAQEETNSDGQVARSELKYVEDYADAAMGGVVGILKSKHILNIPLDQRKLKNGKVIDGTISILNPDGQLSEIHKLESATPINVGFTTGNVKPVSAPYNLKTSLAYSDKRIQTISSNNEASTSLLWGYNGMYLVGEIKNANYTATNAALSSVGMNWQTFYANPTEANIHTKLSELREAMPNAFIKGLSYKPLVGLTKQSEVNGLTTNYVYDDFNRLSEIRDNEDNLVKDYTYNYVVLTNSSASNVGFGANLNEPNGTFELTWSYPVPTEVENFEIKKGVGTAEPIIISSPSASTTTLEDDLTNGNTLYSYEIRAILKDGTATEWSVITINLPASCAPGITLQLLKNSIISSSTAILDQACYEIVLDEGFETADNGDYTAEILD